jgi:hypothetical protein
MERFVQWIGYAGHDHEFYNPEFHLCAIVGGKYTISTIMLVIPGSLVNRFQTVVIDQNTKDIIEEFICDKSIDATRHHMNKIDQYTMKASLEAITITKGETK